jgi:hypothetical protein
METKNLDIYGHRPLPWSRAAKQLQTSDGPGPGRAYWLATTRPDGRSHVAAVGAFWDNGKFYFTSGDGTRKSRNLAKNPACTISTSLTDLDLVVEGTAAKVTDVATLERIAQVAAAGGWPARVENGAFTYDYSAPSAGPPPWYLYEVTPSRAFGVATDEPHGATRWTFED